MFGLDRRETLFVIWAFVFQIILIIHFAIRKPLFESYTLKYGWLVYALCIPAAIVSIIMLRGGKDWTYAAAGFIFVVWAALGYYVDYVLGINWRAPIKVGIMIPYVLLYLATMMFYWFPLIHLYRPLFFVYMVLYVIAMVLNIQSH